MRGRGAEEAEATNLTLELPLAPFLRLIIPPFHIFTYIFPQSLHSYSLSLYAQVRYCAPLFSHFKDHGGRVFEEGGGPPLRPALPRACRYRKPDPQEPPTHQSSLPPGKLHRLPVTNEAGGRGARR
jgi:hypothetical protein